MATRHDRRAARAKPSAAALSRDLASSRARILGLEDRLAGAFEKVFNQAGRIAARKFREKTAVAVTAAAPAPEGTMVAVYPTPEQAAALAQEGGEPAEILHVTLAYLGKTTPEEADRAVEITRAVAAGQPASPLQGEIVGVSTFNPDPEADEPLYPSIALPDVPGLAQLRAAVCEALDAAGIWYSTDHEWTPHITISYQPEATPPPRELIGQPVTFDALTLSRGDVPIHMPLGRVAASSETATARMASDSRFGEAWRGGVWAGLDGVGPAGRGPSRNTNLLAAGEPPWTPPAIDEVVDVPAIVSALHTKADPVRRSAIREYGSALDGIANWDVTNPLASGVLAGAAQHVTAIAETTRLNVMRTIASSYEQGLSIPETARAIQAGMQAASGARARLIARTELAAVANGGSLASAQIFASATGDTLFKRWLTAPGAEHPRHELIDGLDGQTVALDDAFDVSGERLMFPADPDGSPENTCNCRCALIYVGSPNEVIEPQGAAEDDVPPEDMTKAEFDKVNPSYDWGSSGEIVKRWDALPKDDRVWLYHATDKETAAKFAVGGIDPAAKPMNLARARHEAGEAAEYGPGRGLASGLTVGFDPRAVEGYGRSIVAVRVRVGDVVASPEQVALGATTPGQALAVNDAFVTAKIEPYDVRLIGDAARDVPYGEQRIPGHPYDEFVKQAKYEREHGLPGPPQAPLPLSRIADAKLSSASDVGLAVPTGDAGIAAAASDEMKSAIGERFAETQAELRSNPSAELTNALKKVDTAIGGGILDRGAVSLRGVDDMRPMFGEGWPPKVGDVAYDPGYASTTLDGRVAARYAKGKDAGYVTYHLAPGQNGLWVPGLQTRLNARNEKELLLPRGLPLRVIGVGKRGGLPDVHVEIVGRGVTPGLADYGKLAEVAQEPLTGASPYSLAGPIIRNAARSEAEVTAALTHAVGTQGGTFEGLPFRVKSAPSIARKIEKIMGKGVPLQAAATGIKDGLRYTAIFDPQDYVRSMTATLDELKAKAGILSERISATWEPGVEYAGTNVVMRAPNGLRFELQFHTPESYNVKEHVNHGFYQQQRRLEEGTPEWNALADTMLKNANAVERPPGVLEWKYEASVEADIGVTPFREGVDDPFGFYDKARFKTFEMHAEKIADSYGVTIDAKLKVPSVWEGVEEPGVSIHAHDGEKGVAAFAADLGKVYDQQGVLLFSPTLGEDIIATFDRHPERVIGRDETLAAMERAGLPGGRFLEDGRLQIIGSGPAFVSQLDAVGRDLGGVGYDSALGRFSLLRKADGDYEAALRDFASAEGQPVRAPRAAVEEHGGTPPVVPGAPGGKEAARQAVAALGQAPLPHIPHWSLAEVKKMTDDELWGALAINGKIENIARADVTAVESRRLRAEVWRRAELDRRFMEGISPEPGLSLRFMDVAGDDQTHSTFSDGHDTIRSLALAAMKRGQEMMVVSDHSHLMTSADIARQHRQIDKLNKEFRGKFRILKGIEANIDENGYLDVAPEVLAQFDVVGAAIHGTEAVGEQQILFPHSETERFLNVLNSPHLDVLAHPHALSADWDAVAKKAAESGVALEINGRSLLRADSADEAAKMIAAAKKYGAKLAIGSDAHNAGDIVDAAYAVRFAAEHGVVADDLVSFQRRGSLIEDPSTTLPGDREVNLSTPDSRSLGGGMNQVFKVQKGDQTLIVKPDPDPNVMLDHGIDSGNPLRANIEPGRDLERERAAYIVSRYFNEAGGADFHVNVPPYRISEVSGIPEYHSDGWSEAAPTTRRAGIATFIPGVEGRSLPYWQDAFSEDEIRDAGLFDTIIGNTDRHAGNFLLGEDEHLWLIDHGLSFPDGPSDYYYENSVLADAARGLAKDRLSPKELSFLERLRDAWSQMEDDLRGSGLGLNEIREMRERLDYMIRLKERLRGSGSNRDEMPPSYRGPTF